MFAFSLPTSVFRGLALAAWAIAGASATAQTVPLAQDTHPYAYSSPESVARKAGVVASHDVHVAGADWLRLRFAGVKLPSGAKLRITSLQDGAQQHLSAKTLAEWQHTSAYFNGPAVRVELLASKAGRAGQFGIVQVMAGKPQAAPESRCGATDDRVASNEPDRARLINIGCTANLMVQGCFITAGHCLSDSSAVDVVEFNVPKSNPNGSLNHPAPKDQYVPTANRRFREGTIGNDWGVFTVAPNSETGMTPLQAQGSTLKPAKKLPAVGDQVQIYGYGVDTGVDSQTQQFSFGPIVGVDTGSTVLDYRADTEGGNSGSAVLSGGRVVAIHTHGGCTSSGGENTGTLFTNAGLRRAFKQVCGTAQ